MSGKKNVNADKKNLQRAVEARVKGWIPVCTTRDEFLDRCRSAMHETSGFEETAAHEIWFTFPREYLLKCKSCKGMGRNKYQRTLICSECNGEARSMQKKDVVIKVPLPPQFYPPYVAPPRPTGALVVDPLPTFEF